MNAQRRGVVAVAIVAAMVVIGLVVLGIVVAGAESSELTARRADGMRAFYAADAGVNMAMREVILGADEDADGTIGTISNDGNSANDPQLGTSRVWVNQSMVNGTTSIVATGTSGMAARKADARVEGVIGGSPQTVMLAWGRGQGPTPRYSVWDGASWGTSQAMPAIGGQVKWVRMKICPTRNETTFITEDTTKRVSVCFYNGSSWGPVTVLSTDTGGLNDRPEDIAYEQVSSEALCVYWKGQASRFGYRTYNGTFFASEQTIPSPFTTECDFLTLYPRPESDEIMLLAADGIAGGKLVASLWNGSSFGSWFTLVPSLETNNNEAYCMAFESQSRKGLAVYSERGQSLPRYRTWNGSAWSAQSSLPSIGAVAQWIRVVADPTSDQIMFASIDSAQDLNVNVWNGSWGVNQELESNLGASDRRRADIIYERGTGRALIVYGEAGVNAIRYRTWNGTAWSAEMTGPSLGGQVEIVHLSRGFANGEVFIAVSDTQRRLHVLRWDGASMSAPTTVEGTLSGWPQYYSFALPEPTVAPHPRIQNWAEIAP